MFERRLRVLLAVLGFATLVVVGRLFELQIVHGQQYRLRAERSGILRPRPLPFVRGSILDRSGELLVSDEPSWDLKIDYRVIEAEIGDDPSAFKRAFRRWRSRYGQIGSMAEKLQAFRVDLASTWELIAMRFSQPTMPLSVTVLRERAREIYDRVRRIHKAVAARRGFDSPVAEERIAHTIVSGLDAQTRILARESFGEYPWVHVEPAARRTFHGDATPFAHVLGKLGRVDARVVADDPNADDPFVNYRADESLGVSGVEFSAEAQLRGRRGQVTRDRDGSLVDPVIEAEDGRDVVLTIHAELQRRLYQLLGAVVGSVPASSGGVIVVLDVATREALAMVSYPSYDPNEFTRQYATLRDDTDRLPLRFRAVANRYAPGSTVKPLVCLAGLMNGRIALETREECTGYLLEEHRDRWRCWAVRGTGMRKAHGYVNVVEALTGSCNVFMYRLGERLTVDGLCSAFDMFGIGRTSGTGLREEAKGINPTPGWLMQHKNSSVYPGHARLFAIGQGELSMTPLQVANMMATFASGRFQPVTLIRTDTPPPKWTIPATAEQWSAIRRGIYGVVNDPTGTAYKHAHFVREGYALCGKTGSATAHPWPTLYRVVSYDTAGQKHEALVPAGSKQRAIENFMAEHPCASPVENRCHTVDHAQTEVARKWPPQPPPDGENYSHAWFGGYLQAVDANGQPQWSEEPRIAFAILVEFGGSGGRTSGPLAKRVAGELLDLFGPELNVGASALAGAYP